MRSFQLGNHGDVLLLRLGDLRRKGRGWFRLLSTKETAGQQEKKDDRPGDAVCGFHGADDSHAVRRGATLIRGLTLPRLALCFSWFGWLPCQRP